MIENSYYVPSKFNDKPQSCSGEAIIRAERPISPHWVKFGVNKIIDTKIDNSPAPNTYYDMGVPSSLNGPKFSFWRVRRNLDEYNVK